jgi:glycosyltransferase involved in cell wall biosynthesis
MRVLLSAIGCHPEHGSEGGIGWNAVRALSSENELHVMTSVSQRPALEAAVLKGECPNVTFSFFGTDKPYHPNRLIARCESWVRYFKWINQSYHHALHLLSERKFDLAHQVTYSSWRVASPLWQLPIPFVWGPVGGVAKYPWHLLNKLSASGALFEVARNLSNRAAMLSPALRACARGSTAVIGSNRESARVLRRLRGHDRDLYQITPMAFTHDEMVRFTCDPASKPQVGRLELFAGGSMVGSKGIVFGLEAMAFVLKLGIDCRFTIASGGPEISFLKKRTRQLSLEKHVVFNDGYGGTDYPEALKSSHACLIPSFRENVGITLLEGMLAGCVPVIIDASAQGENVPDNCGIKVPVGSAQEISEGLAQGLLLLARNTSARINMARRAQKHVRESFSRAAYSGKINAIYKAVMKAGN